MAVAAVAAAGLVGVGLVGVSQFASADDPQLDAASQPASASAAGDDEAPPTTEGETPTPPPTTEGDVDQSRSVDGQIVIDTGDGPPMVIDLGECLGANGDLFDFGIDGEAFPFGEDFDPETFFEDFDPSEFFDRLPSDQGAFEVFGADTGNMVTVMGPDGPTLYDLGDGDGSVTVTQTDGVVTVETSGDVTKVDIADLFGDLSSEFERFSEELGDGSGSLGVDPGQFFDLEGCITSTDQP